MGSVTLLRQLVSRTRVRCGPVPVSPISCCHVQQPRIQDTWIRMSTTTGKSHLERTGDKPRDPDLHKVTVTQLAGISPSVKKVVLTSAVTPVPFSFKAGQWVDLHVPGIPKIGGFTITSSPKELEATGSFHLAIQDSAQQPAHWVHTTCQVGDGVSIRVGGDFFFDRDRETRATTAGLLLIGGGVGINPLSAIIKEIHGHGSQSSSGVRIPTVLLFSAKTHQELLFREEFEFIMTQQQDTNFVCKFFVTGTTSNTAAAVNDRGITKGRIGLEEIKEGLRILSAMTGGAELDKVKVYICGPPPMIEVIEEMTKELNVKNVACEKWW